MILWVKECSEPIMFLGPAFFRCWCCNAIAAGAVATTTAAILHSWTAAASLLHIAATLPRTAAELHPMLLQVPPRGETSEPKVNSMMNFFGQG